MAAASPASAAGALAVGHCGVDGYSYDSASPEQAEETALQECGPGCRIVAAFQGSCAAFAVDHSRSCGAEGWGRARVREEAEIHCDHRMRRPGRRRVRGQALGLRRGLKRSPRRSRRSEHGPALNDRAF